MTCTSSQPLSCHENLNFITEFVIVLILIDMGHGEIDDTRQVLKLEQPSLDTTRNLVREMSGYDLLLHVGDLSYADGYEAIVGHS